MKPNLISDMRHSETVKFNTLLSCEPFWMNFTAAEFNVNRTVFD